MSRSTPPEVLHEGRIVVVNGARGCRPAWGVAFHRGGERGCASGQFRAHPGEKTTAIAPEKIDVHSHPPQGPRLRSLVAVNSTIRIFLQRGR